ncbi:MAG: hypothetical protein AAGA20_22915 [Planctomycetota bacterium]
MRTHLAHLDRAIARMLDERARLARTTIDGGAQPAAVDPFVDDLLRRAEGDFPANELRAVFEAVARGCRSAAGEEVTP